MLRKLIRSMSNRMEMAETQALAAAITLFGMLGLSDHETEAKRRAFSRANRAQMGGADDATNLVVGLVVAGLMAAFLLPIAIEEIANVTTTGWSDGAASLWNVLPIMIVLAIFLFFTGLALKSR